ncbi:MAG TPA: anti-sigma factor [Stellaceae bacterium]|nr:anti-sigma factor [Stellaceae bacterium]
MSANGDHAVPSCDKVLLVQAELDGELDAAQAAALEAHRGDCAICQAAQTELLRARELLRGEAYEITPEDVRARVMARLRQAEPRPAPARRWRWVFPSLGGFGLGAACAAALALLVVLPQRSDLAGQLVAGHIRALQPGHLEDVVSTDQHTVKPWFDGRLDFAPPVRDFASDGFPLKGGRLDYLDGRPVAALIYQRDKHVIDVFVWPQSGAVQHLASNTVVQGYNVVHWTAEGMNFWAVSDVERAQLDDFAALWRTAP